MLRQRVALLASVLIASCAHPSTAFDPGVVPSGPAALVRPDQALFVFPAPDLLQPCYYRRAADPSLRLFSWTVNVGGSSAPEWYAIDVWPAVPDSIFNGAPVALTTILQMAKPEVARVGGEPPIFRETIDRTHVEAHAVGNSVVVVLTSPKTIDRLFRHRPRSVGFVACLYGQDSWNREVPLQYTP
jgi:hypothetical protein